MYCRVGVPVVVDSDNVKLLKHSGIVWRAVNGGHYHSRIVKLFGKGLEVFDYLSAVFGCVVKLLVAKRPEKDRRAISVSLHQHFKLCLTLVA